ncbi:2'-5' RNA ligase family protein [Nocardia sp. NBC_01388]|uniref:2'-5' RNA ligase family protein n=1 Tax=Nocardia sp. NBC_01388 TaxID=2903596 RepID=UPI00324A232E
MEPYFVGDRVRPQGQASLELYVVPDPGADTDLTALLDRATAVLQRFPAVAVTLPHMTIQPITHRPAAQISDLERAELISALGETISNTPAFDVLVGPAFASTVGVLMDVYPEAPVESLILDLRKAITQVAPRAAVDYDARPAHMTVGYARQHADSGVITSALRRGVRPSHARLRVHTLTLVEVWQDLDLCQYIWRTLRTFPLGAPGSTTAVGICAGTP